MSIARDILNLVTFNERANAATPFATLGGRLESLIVKLSSDAFAVGLAAEIRALAAGVAVEVTRGTLDTATPWRHKGELTALRRDVVGSAQALIDRDNLTDYLNRSANAADLRASFLSELSRVHRLEASWLRSSSFQRWLWTAIVAVATGGTAAVIAGTYLASRDGFDLESVEVHAPLHVASNKDSGRHIFSIADADRKRFVRVFTPYYFRRSGDFSRQLIEAPSSADDAALIGRLKLDLRSRTRIGTSFVSAIGIRLQLMEEQPFPWDQMDAPPDLKSAFHRPPTHFDNVIEDYEIDHPVGSFYLSNVGVGPALRVNAKIAIAGGPVLQVEKQGFLHDTTMMLTVAAPGQEVSPWPLRIESPRPTLGVREFSDAYLAEPWAVETSDGSPVLLYPLYAELDQNAEPSAGAAWFTHDDKRYEVLTTLTQLQHYTEVFYQRGLELTVDYESIAGQRHRLRRVEPPLLDWCFYRRDDSVLEFDPRILRPAPRKLDGAAPAPTGRLLEAFAEQFVPPDSDPKGVDHVMLEAQFHLHGIREGETVGQAVMVDRFINSHGTITVYIKLTGHCTGRWEAKVIMDGAEVGCAEFETLVPEVLRFPDSQEGREKELQRLTSHLRQN